MIAFSLVSAFLIASAAAISRPMEKLISVVPKTDKTVLCLGKDRAGSNTDVMMLVRINGFDKSASVMQIPRDTHILYSDIPIKLNSLYGRLLSSGIDSSGVLKELTSVISLSLGVRIDGAVMIDLDSFVRAVDMIGGVTVDIPFDMEYTDEKQGLYIDLKAGRQLLDGNMAEQLVRCRSIYVRADLGRIDAQKLFLSSLASKLKSELSANELVKLAEVIIKDCEMTLDVSCLPSLAASALELSLSDSVIFTAPGETTKDGGFYVLNQKGMESCLTKYFVKTDEFDIKKAWRGFLDDEIRGLYGSFYKNEPQKSIEDIIENGVTPSLKK